MPTSPLDPKVVELVQQYLRMGLSQRQIVLRMRDEHGITVSQGSVCNCKIIKQLRYQAPGIRSDKKHGEFHWREWTRPMQEFQRLKKKGSSSQDTAVIELGDGTHPVALAPFSDLHMGAWSTDYETLQRMTDELLKTKNLFVGLLGDYGHYAIKLRNVLEVADNLLPPEQQTQFLESWFDEIWHKVAFATWENHGVERQEKQAGESSTKKILSKRVIYFNGIGHISLKVGEQIYYGAVSHYFRGRSMLNPVHSLMRYMRFEGTDREWAIAGDSHLPGMIKYTDGDRTRVAINCGALQNNSGYAKRYFSLTTHPVYPILVFYPDRHQVTPFWSIKEWLDAKGGK